MALKLLSGQKQVFEQFKMTFFSFVQIFEWRSRNHFLGKLGKALKTF